MDSENQDRCSPGRSEPDETSEGTQKQSRISYARDFLLSLAELDECKNLPSGFDSSLLSEFNDPNSGMSECQRVASNQSLHSFKSSVYASSQSNHNSDSGQQNVKQYGRPWQKFQYDGVLGNVAFPRVYAGASRASAPTAQGSGLYQLNRHKEPYCPLRPFEFVCGLGKQNIDLYNDETFGSAEYLDHETAEEEKRRVSFELMRKEQEKPIQEQKKQNDDGHKENFDPDNSALLKDSANDNSIVNTINGSEECLILPASTTDPAEVSLPARLPASRPVIPPGFSNKILEKNLGTKPLAHSPLSEHDDAKAECPGSSMVHSSNFAHLLCEEEKKPAVVILSSKEKGGTQVSGVKTAEVNDRNFPNFFSEINQLTCKPIIPTLTFGTEGISGQLVSCNKPSVTPAVLTCEDLEQSILSDMKENNSTQNHSVQNWSLYAKDDQPNSANDNGSSQYLLSLLQNEVSLKDLAAAPNKFSHPAVDKCGRSIVISSEDMVASEFSKLGEFNLIEGTRTGSEGFDGKDGSTIEICLPEEDSLITVDDPIIPQHSVFKPTWNSLEPNFTTPADNIAVQLADLNHVLGDERSAIPSLEGSPFLRSLCGIMGSETPYHDLHAQKSYPQFQHSRMDPQRPSNFLLDSPQLSSQTRSMGWKNYRHSPRTPHYTPENVHPQSFAYTPAAPTRFDYPVHNSLQHVPDGFPVNQPKLNLQRFPQHHQQLRYGGFGVANTAPAVRGKSNSGAFHRPIEMVSRARQRYPYAVDETLNIPIEMHPFAMGATLNKPMETEKSAKEMHPFAVDAAFNMPIEMERRGRQMRPLTPRVRGRGTYNRQFDMGFWNGQ
ncbi:hypothetical protein VitviT2T_025145 [Vitis vinifera]|uniref:Uncharacterized protein n=1 Tax=Vitis vinifera TaxID=29760 RepID=A0ABY9DKD1_VITVI|nr:uncharacterized protein LOC104882190 [Vitis vinifera]WKA07301.1 hypothetical protein VitviT2T_025145 [Vitis vinifera]|eukprot:XP_010662678.1 PREDICTED: uncharacterized protein LOC104882190 [Vitis vinifera]